MKKQILKLTLLAMLASSTLVVAEDSKEIGKVVEVSSLRGTSAIADKSKAPKVKKWVNNDVILSRQFVQQPPIIPHKIENYKITTKANKCLGCHSWGKAAETGATKISLTHYTDRDGKELSNVSARRYFCTQCHVPQKNAKEIVGNSYKNANNLK